ncbi:unnamed protein product [Candida verbasci]|uniref:Enoyl reductase (ER) domain-containing protein n=1 Tax=Candida verbasci TaxID=1227364 RepID=A0A9W4XBH3_9ASCO|nr:unnamed protein product [Candida verbasci]
MSIPITQYGFLYNQSKGLQLKNNLPVPKPSENEVLLKIDAVGLCHSDLHIIYDEIPCGDNYVMGHEIAGTIVLIGAKVSDFKVGDRVALAGANGCGLCENCRTGFDNICESSFINWFGLGIDGGYQQYLLIKRIRNLIRIPDNVTSEAAAALTDAALTPYHATLRANIGPTSNCLIIGAGGLGLNAIQIVKCFGAKVTVLDTKEKARVLAKKNGADYVYDTLPSEIKPGTFNICIDFVSKQSTFDLCQIYCQSRGSILPIGLGSTKLELDLGNLALREISILGSFWGSSNDLKDVLQLASEGRLNPHVSTASLKELPKYIEKLKEGSYEGRYVFIP